MDSVIAENIRILYIAGKMTGLPDKGRQEFMNAERILKEKYGRIILNPATLPDGMPGERYMPICMAMIDQADAVIMLPNWTESKGARLEREYAKYQGKTIIYVRKSK